MTELRQMADDMADDVIKGVVRVVTPLKHRIEALEKRQPDKGEPGKDGASGLTVKGDPGDKGKDGEPGKDGVSIKGDPGKDGKDADAEAIAATVLDKVTKALDEIPAAKDGKDADPEFVRSVVRDEVTRAVQALPPPQAGKDGASVDMVALSGEVMAAAAKAVVALPVPKDGRDFDPVLLKAEVERAVAALPPAADAEIVAELVERAVSALPPAPKGEDGKDGTNGRDANPDFIKATIAALLPALVDKAVDEIADRITKRMEIVRREALDAVETQIKALPPAQNGKDADPEVMLRMVRETAALIPTPKDGINGKDGRDAPLLDEIIPAVLGLVPVARHGRDAPTLEELRPLVSGEVAKAVALIPPAEPGRDGRDAAGKNGENGADGLGFDDMEALRKDDRTIVLAFTRGDRTKEFEFRFPVPLDRGTYQPGKSYEAGDGVTYGGSWWLAQKDTGESPGNGSPDWRLVVKRGQNGKDAA